MRYLPIKLEMRNKGSRYITTLCHLFYLWRTGETNCVLPLLTNKKQRRVCRLAWHGGRLYLHGRCNDHLVWNLS